MTLLTTLVTTVGAGTYVKRVGVTQIMVECWGAGAPGGDGQAGCGGSGGGGGGYARSILNYDENEQLINYFVGDSVGAFGLGFSTVVQYSAWDDTGTETLMGPQATPFSVYYKVLGAGGRQFNVPGSCFEFGGRGGGETPGDAILNPNIGDVIYNGGQGAKSGGSASGGGGAAGSSGTGSNSGTDRSVFSTVGGAGRTEFGGAGGDGLAAGQLYGGGGGGGPAVNGGTGAAGAQGLIRITELVEGGTSRYDEIRLDWTSTTGDTGTLVIPAGYIDNWSSWSQPRAGSKFIRTAYGEEDAWYVADDYYCSFDVRFIRQTSPFKENNGVLGPLYNDILANGSPWEYVSDPILGISSWAPFLENAQLGMSVDLVLGSLTIANYVVAPVDRGASINQDGTRTLSLTFRNPTTPYTDF